MMKSTDSAVQLLLDRAELHDLQTKYAQCVDERNWEQLKSVFLKEGLRARYREEFTDAEGVVKMISGVARFHTTYHFMGNRIVEVFGDEATSKTNAQLTHHFTIDKLEYQFNPVGGSYGYIDKLRRTGPNGEWQVYDRGDRPDWTYVGVTKVASQDPAVRYLLDRAEIQDVLLQFGLGMELRDWKRVAACFAPEIRVEERGHAYTTTNAAYTESLKSVEKYEFVKHLLANHLIELHGDTAEMDSYGLLTYARKWTLTGAPQQWSDPGVRYSDTFVRRNGRWVIGSHRLKEGTMGRGAPPPSSKDPAVQYLLDRAEIADAVHRFEVGVDRRDYDLVRNACAPKITVHALGKTFTTADELIGFMRGRVEEFWQTTHFMGNQLITVQGNEAMADTYCYLMHRDSPETPWSDWAKGGRRFKDKFVKSNGRWLLTERSMVTNRTTVPEHSIRSFPAMGLGKPLGADTDSRFRVG